VACNVSGSGNIPFWDIRIQNGNLPSPASGYPQIELYSADNTGDFSVVSTTNINDGLWHHIAFVRRGADVYLYEDGVLNAHNNDGTVHNVSNSAPVILGSDTCQCCDGTLAYSGAADELDLWNRALTDVEVAALYRAGANHLSKATTVSTLPNCHFLVNGVTNSTVIATNASGTNWTTNVLYFTGFSNTTSIVLQGNALGMLFDDFQIIGPTNFNYVLPEESLGSFTGENPVGCWTLDVWDTRTDSPLPTNGTLFSWNLQMTISATNVNLIVLTNHVPFTNGVVQSNSIQYFAFDVPFWANFATNTLANGSTNLTLYFNQTALPTGSQLGDYTLITGTNAGVYVLTNNAPPPTLVPGQRYFLGVASPGGVAATFSLTVDTDTNSVPVTPLTNGIPLMTNILVSSNAVPYTTNLFATNAPQYYSFEVPPNAILASFEILNPADQINLYVRHTLSLPSSTSYDFAASYDGTNDEAIVVTTNSYALVAGVPDTNVVESVNSTPVALTPGTWYLAVYDYNASKTNAVNYTIEATFITNSVTGGVTNNAITITPLTNAAPLSNQLAAAGPALTNFYSFTITNAAPGVQFVVSNMTQNVDLIAGNGALPTPQQMTAGSFNPGTNLAQVITIVTNATLLSLSNTVWY
jgi:hypothetical protein